MAVAQCSTTTMTGWHWGDRGGHCELCRLGPPRVSRRLSCIESIFTSLSGSTRPTRSIVMASSQSGADVELSRLTLGGPFIVTRSVSEGRHKSMRGKGKPLNIGAPACHFVDARNEGLGRSHCNPGTTVHELVEKLIQLAGITIEKYRASFPLPDPKHEKAGAARRT